MTHAGVSPSLPSSPVRPRIRDRHLLAVVLLSVLAFVARGYLVARAHSPTIDAGYHVDRGVSWWKGDLAGKALHDPPLGGAVSVVPLVLTRSIDPRPGVTNWIMGHHLSADALYLLVAVWRSVLIAAVVPVCFAWARRLYGLRAAWVCGAALLVEPNVAAHVPHVGNDALGMLAIVAVSVLAWRYFERPTTGRLAAMAAAVPVALMLKATSVVLPPVIGLYAVLWWVWRPWRDGRLRDDFRAALGRRAGHVAVGALVAIVSLLAVTRFERVPPLRANAEGNWGTGTAATVLRQPWPAGAYVRSFAASYVMSRKGHHGYLLGDRRYAGWWYYFPVVAAVKVPVPLLLLMAVGVASLRGVRWRFDEWGLAVPAALLGLLLLTSKVNIGVRHLLPLLPFLLMFSVRWLPAAAPRTAGRDRGRRWPTAVAGALVGVAGLHVTLGYHPDYLSYFNFPYDKPWLIVSDSNVDWGQSRKQLDRWAAGRGGRPVRFVSWDGDLETIAGPQAKTAAARLTPETRPTSGLLVVSPVAAAGVYDELDLLAALRPLDPDAVIGHNLLAYDLDRLGGAGGGAGEPFAWPPPGPEVRLAP